MGDRYKNLMEDHSYEEDDRYDQIYSEEVDTDPDDYSDDDYSDDRSWKQQKNHKKSKKQRRREREMMRNRQEYDDHHSAQYREDRYSQSTDQEDDQYTESDQYEETDDFNENNPAFVQIPEPVKENVSDPLNEDSPETEESEDTEDPGETIQREKAFIKFKDRFVNTVSPALSAVKNRTTGIFTRKKKEEDEPVEESFEDHRKDPTEISNEKMRSKPQRNWKKIRKQTVWVTAISTLILAGTSGAIFLLDEDPSEMVAQKASMEETSSIPDLDGDSFKKPGELLSKTPVQLQGGEKKPGSGGPLRKTAEDRTAIPEADDLKKKLNNFIDDVDQKVKKETKNLNQAIEKKTTALDQSVQKESKNLNQLVENEIKKPVNHLIDKTRTEVEKAKSVSGLNVEFNPNGSGTIKITPETKTSIPDPKTSGTGSAPNDKTISLTFAPSSDKEKSNPSRETLPLKAVSPKPVSASPIAVPAAKTPLASSDQKTTPNVPPQELKPQPPAGNHMLSKNPSNANPSVSLTPSVPATSGSTDPISGSTLTLSPVNNSNSLIPNGPSSTPSGNSSLQPMAASLPDSANHQKGSLSLGSTGSLGSSPASTSLQPLSSQDPIAAPATGSLLNHPPGSDLPLEAPVRIQTSPNPANTGQMGATFVPLQPIGTGSNPSISTGSPGTSAPVPTGMPAVSIGTPVRSSGTPTGSPGISAISTGAPVVSIGSPLASTGTQVGPLNQGAIGQSTNGTGQQNSQSTAMNPYRIYTTRDGDNLLSIAGSELGDPMRWVEIKRLNPDPVSKLNLENPVFPVGTKLYLP